MSESDEQSNLPVPQQTYSTKALEIPVAEFEGEYVRLMIGKIPAITLEMDHGYPRDTHLKLELEVRVRSVTVDEVTSGRNKGDLMREHKLVIEEAKIIGAYTAEELDEGVGGGLAATGNDVEDDENNDSDDRSEDEIKHEESSDERVERDPLDPGF